MIQIGYTLFSQKFIDNLDYITSVANGKESSYDIVMSTNGNKILIERDVNEDDLQKTLSLYEKLIEANTSIEYEAEVSVFLNSIKMEMKVFTDKKTIKLELSQGLLNRNLVDQIVTLCEDLVTKHNIEFPDKKVFYRFVDNCNSFGIELRRSKKL